MTHERALKLFIEAVEAGATLKEAENAVYLECLEAGEKPLDADAIAFTARQDYEALKK